MKLSIRKGIIPAVLLLFACQSALAIDVERDNVKNFIDTMVEKHSYDREKLESVLGQAESKESILEAIARPAERRLNWGEYRNIFMTKERIAAGTAFWQENDAELQRISDETGVSIEILVGIIGVETFYGRITGNYRVLDALTTLSFYYPDTGNDRSGFFSRELMNFVILGGEENLPLEDVTGSYAGAMGLGQFMPSSYREYAVDLDGDGRRDLWSSLPDVIGSVANYLHRHGWEPGQPISHPAVMAAGADMGLVAKRDFKPKIAMDEIVQGGFTSSTPVSGDTLATVASLEEKDGNHYFITFKNFYVITRYNRSPLYAMAVYELSEAIRNGFER